MSFGGSSGSQILGADSGVNVNMGASMGEDALMMIGPEPEAVHLPIQELELQLEISVTALPPPRVGDVNF